MAIQPTSNDKPNSQQSTTKVVDTMEQRKNKKTTEANNVVVPATYRIATTSLALLQPIIEALNKILDSEDSTECIIEGIFKYINESEKKERISRDSKCRRNGDQPQHITVYTIAYTTRRQLSCMDYFSSYPPFASVEHPCSVLPDIRFISSNFRRRSLSLCALLCPYWGEHLVTFHSRSLPVLTLHSPLCAGE